MTQKIINIGTAANKGDGDVLRTAFSKINDNFTELYAVTADDVQIPTQTNNGGKYLTTNGSTLSWATIATDSVSSITDFGEGFSLNGANKIVTNKLYSTNETQPTQHYRLELDTNGVVHLPDQSIINGATLKSVAGNYAGITAGPVGKDEDSWMWVDSDGAWIATKYNTSAHTWQFTNTGALTLPEGEGIFNQAGIDSGLNIRSNNVTNQKSIYLYSYGSDGDGTGAGNIYINPTNVEIYSSWNAGGSGERKWTFGNDGTFNLPESVSTNNAIIQTPSAINLQVNSNGKIWTFGTDGTLTLPDGANVVHGDVRLSLNVDEGTAAYLTTTTDDTTALYMTTTGAQLYASESVSISVGAGVADLENTYIGAMAVVEFVFAEETLTPGYPWGITLPVSHATYAELILLAPDTFTAQAMITVAAKTASDAWDAWQLALGNTNISIVTGNNSWEFGIDGTTLFPNGAKLANGAGYQFATDNTVVQSLDLRDTTGRGFYTNNDGFTLRSNGSHNWVFKSIATLNLPNFGSVPGPTDGAVGDICRNDDVLYFKTSSGWATINLT